MGPRNSLLLSIGATLAVTVLPTFAVFSILVFGQPDPQPFLATVVSIVAITAAIVIGAQIWKTQPESTGFAFGDLMVWSWRRRKRAERSLRRNATTLGFDRAGTAVDDPTTSLEERTWALHDIARAMDAKSYYTLGHSERVAGHALNIAEALDLSAEETETLVTAAELHDVGNIALSDEVLFKADDLDPAERVQVEQHVGVGAALAGAAGFGDDVVDAIRHHHEEFDGTGYPARLMGDSIPRAARIVAIAEAYDALTSTRPYRNGMTGAAAVDVLRTESGTRFDPALVETFIDTLPSRATALAGSTVVGFFRRQAHEFGVAARRVGGIAISAAASTIVIALILGGTVLSEDGPPWLRGRDVQPRPVAEDEVLGTRISADPETEAAEDDDDDEDGGAGVSPSFSERQVASGPRMTTFDASMTVFTSTGIPSGSSSGSDGGTDPGTEPEPEPEPEPTSEPEPQPEPEPTSEPEPEPQPEPEPEPEPEPTEDPKPGKGNGNGNGHGKDKDGE